MLLFAACADGGETQEKTAAAEPTTQIIITPTDIIPEVTSPAPSEAPSESDVMTEEEKQAFIDSVLEIIEDIKE